jgi:hypothetical protein
MTFNCFDSPLLLDATRAKSILQSFLLTMPHNATAQRSKNAIKRNKAREIMLAAQPTSHRDWRAQNCR